MDIFKKVRILSTRIASSLLRNESPEDLLNSDLFDDQKKLYIMDNLTNKEKINERTKIIRAINVEEDWEKVARRIQSPVRKIVFWQYASIAASIIVIVSVYFYQRDNTVISKQIKSVVVNPKIKPGTDKATLKLGNGKTIVLGQGNNFNANGITANAKNIIYNSTTTKVEYNYLTIPRGGQFTLNLADGTKVWINSQSQLKFPNHFIKGQSRIVELIYGEAYFDVASSKENFGANFKVITAGQEVVVLGTEFNIKAYKDDKVISTSLVEGSVNVKNHFYEKNIKPGQASYLNVDSGNLTVEKVDIENVIAWKKGYFVFNNESLQNMTTILSRWYNVDFVFENEQKKQLRFTGELNRTEDIQNLLKKIEKTDEAIFDIKKDKIIIK